MSDLSPALLASVSVCAAGVTLVGATLVRGRRFAPDIAAFMGGLGAERPVDEYERRMTLPFGRRLFETLLGGISRHVERLLPARHAATIRKQLLLAGIGDRWTPTDQVLLQGACALAGALAAIALRAAGFGSGSLSLLMPLLPVMGFMLPSARLKRKGRARSEAIFKDLPDIIDMLAVTLEAGSGFEGAVDLVCRNFHSPLADELSTMLQEMQLGMSRREALQELKSRTELDELRTFVVALVQADSLGIPLGRVLKTQATEMRSRRRAWAREKAAKLPVKILFPLILFIFPPLMVIVIGPAMGSISNL